MDTPLIIDPDLQELIPPPEESELLRLEASLQRDGCLDALKAWRNGDELILLDGHTRIRLCQKLNLPYRVEVVESVTNRYEAIQWMIDLQLARRNLSPERQSYLRGRRYNEEKCEVGAPTGNDNATGEKQIGQNVTIVSTAERIANEYGITDRTIKRDALYASAIDSLPPTERFEILAGKSGKRKGDIVREYLEKTGHSRARREKQFEKLYLTDTRKAIQMLEYHLQAGSHEVQLEILSEILTFLNRAPVQPTDVDRLWSQIKRKDI